MSRSPLHRAVLIGLLAVTATAGCDPVTADPGAGAVTTATPSAEPPLAPRVIAQVGRLRTATARVTLTVGGSGGRAELSGPVEYADDGVHADLTGTIAGNKVHLIALGGTVYVAQLFPLPAGTTWLRMEAGGERVSESPYWAYLDEIVTALTYVTDGDVLAGLAYNAAPAETLDGVSVRTALRTATRSEMFAKLKPPQLFRYQRLLQEFTGARILVSAGSDAIPRRLVVTFTGTGAYPTVEVDYTGWATTTVAIVAPSGPEVRDYP